MNNKYLVVVDMQNDFITGSLGTKEAQGIVPLVVERIKKAKAEGWEIFCTKDTHYPDYPMTKEGQKLPVPHCMYGTDGHNIHPDVLAAMAEYPVMEYTKNTFGCINLADDIANFVRNELPAQNFAAIEIIGLCTDICVVANALLLKAFLPEASISVNASCCAGVTPELHEAALTVMRSCQIDIIGG